MLPESPQADVQVLMLLEESVLRGIVQYLRSRTLIPLGEDLGKQPLEVAEVLVDVGLSEPKIRRRSVWVFLACSCREERRFCEQ